MFIHLRHICVGGNSLFYQKALCTRTITKCSRIMDADLLPMPNNVDIAESTRFSPRRNREISATVIVSQNYQGVSPSQCDITVENYDATIAEIKHDPHVQSYDCFGTVNLNSAMQSNVPSPFGGMHKFSHLNMPRGQWSQESKFTSQNLQNSHYTVLRKNTRSTWSSYENSDTNLKGDSAESLNDFKRSYCTNSSDQQQVLSKKEQLKQAFRDYGSTIITFHIAVSLASLGSFYLLISSGIDVIAQLENLGYAPDALKNKVAVGASNFVIAYAIHKIFAPVRISFTLGMAPFIVRYLRSKGLLKPKNVKQ